MDTMFLYLKWRGDLDFNNSPFNNIDNIIFCAISYLNFDKILKFEEIITLEELHERYQKIEESSKLHPNSEKLFKMLSTSKRFKNVKIARYKRINNKTLEEQFGAMTFILPNNILFVTFCGTDESLVGWKEDFNLSYMSVIPAQNNAKIYLEDIIKNSDKDILVGGHSKGGNLAIFATIFCKKEYQKRIIKVFNNDGPGFLEDVLKDINLDSYKDKIITFLPKSSIVGNIFDNKFKIKIIDSYGLGIFQHDLFSWKVEKNDLVYLQKLSEKESELIKKFNQKLENIPIKKRKEIVNFIYDILVSFNINSVDDLLPNIKEITKYLEKYDINFKNIELAKELIEIVIRFLQ